MNEESYWLTRLFIVLNDYSDRKIIGLASEWHMGHYFYFFGLLGSLILHSENLYNSINLVFIVIMYSIRKYYYTFVELSFQLCMY